MSDLTSRDQVFIEKLTRIVLDNLSDSHFGVQELARESGVGYYHLNRKIFAATGKKANYFINEIRLRKALEMLLNEDLTASEVAYKTGFSSPAYFNTSFHEFYGYPPGKVKKGGLANNGKDPIVQVSTVKETKISVLEKLINYKSWLLSGSVLILLGFVFYPKIFPPRSLDDLRSSDGRISIAVMPFENLTKDTIWDGIQMDLISSLSYNTEELMVYSKDAISSIIGSSNLKNIASVSLTAAASVSQKLDAGVFIQGVVLKTGSILKINAQLVNSKSEEVFKSFPVVGPASDDNIFNILDTLSQKIRDYLLISKMQNEVSGDLKPYRQTKSPEAFKYLIMADAAQMRMDYQGAIQLYLNAIAADTNYIPAIVFLSQIYKSLGNIDDASKWIKKAYAKRDNVDPAQRAMINGSYAGLFGTPEEEINYTRQYQDIDSKLPITYFLVGEAYFRLFQYNNAIPEFEKALQIYKKWGVKPLFIFNYSKLIQSLHKTGQYKEEKKYLRKAEKDFPENSDFFYSTRASLALTEGDTIEAKFYIEKYGSSLKALSYSDQYISYFIGKVYSEASALSEAEKYYRQALSLAHDDPDLINNLAYFLIDKDLNNREGMNLVDTVLKSHPNTFTYLHTKGWGLYKQGKSKEALELLQKSWDLKPYYDHQIYTHLEEVKATLLARK